MKERKEIKEGKRRGEGGRECDRGERGYERGEEKSEVRK